MILPKIKSVLSLLIFMFLFSCSHSVSRHTDDPSSAETHPAIVSGLEGIYEACYLTQSGSYSKLNLSFLDNVNFAVLIQSFSSPTCSGNLLSSTQFHGIYILSKTNRIDYYYSNGQILYDIYQLTQDSLKVGYKTVSQDGSNENKRPTTYSGSIRYNRIQ